MIKIIPSSIFIFGGGESGETVPSDNSTLFDVNRITELQLIQNTTEALTIIIYNN